MENKKTENKIENVISRIIKNREKKGYSLENMASELNLSVSAYHKIEQMQTKHTLERLFHIQAILEVPLQELLNIKGETVFHQSLNGQAKGYQASVQHLYKEHKEIIDSLIKTLQEENLFLKKIIENHSSIK